MKVNDGAFDSFCCLLKVIVFIHGGLNVSSVEARLARHTTANHLLTKI